MRRSVLLISNRQWDLRNLQGLPDGELEVALLGKCGTHELPMWLLRREIPDVILADEQSVGLTNLPRLVATVERSWPQTRILVVGSGALERVVAAARSGANGYVCSSATNEELAEMMARAIRNAEFQLPDHAGSPLGAVVPGLFPLSEEHLALEGLTPRERQVVTLMAQRMTNREICEALCISANTVKSHAKHALRKLGARNRVQLAILWRRQAARITASAPAAGMPAPC